MAGAQFRHLCRVPLRVRLAVRVFPPSSQFLLADETYQPSASGQESVAQASEAYVGTLCGFAGHWL